jgi:DNA primase
LAVDREVLKCAVQIPDLLGDSFEGLTPDAFGHPAYAQVAAIIQAGGGPPAAGADQSTWVERLRELAGEEVVRSLITELAVEPLRSDSVPDARYAKAQAARVGERVVIRREGELRSALQRLDGSDPAAMQQVFGELVALEQQRRELRELAVGSG